MASPPVLEIEALLAPISGDDPAGAPVPFDVRDKLEKDRKEEDPADFAEDDPMRPEQAKKADWRNIIRLTQDTLTESSKDLLVAARLLEALVKVHGFAGLRDGLRLLRELVEQCWDRVYPVIEEGDVEIRAGPFNWLDDPDRGARFPSTLRSVPMVVGPDGQYGWLDWKASLDGKGPVSRDMFEQAILATTLEQCETAAEDLAQSVDELNQLTQRLEAQMGEHAPGMTSLRPALEDCHRLMQEILLRKRPGEGGKSDEGAEQPEAGSGARSDGRPAANRAEAYRQLAHAADVLQALEPHSPIPYLVRRAVELGALPFPQLMQALIRDATVLGELNRELGIKESS